MHLVVDQVVQFQIVHHADGNRTVKCVAGASVKELGLSLGRSQVQFLRGFFREGKVEHLTDVAFACAVEHGGCERNTLLQVFSQIDDFVIGQRIKVFLLTAALVVNRVQELTDLCDLLVALVLEHFSNSPAQTESSPAQVNFKNLTDVHSGRHAQRVQNNVNRSAVGHERHIFDTSDAGNHTLVAVTTGHLVTGLQTTLNS